MPVSITDPARERVLEVRSAEPEPDQLALWVEIVGLSAGGYAYDMAFLRKDEIEESDVVVDGGDGLTIVVPRLDVPALSGATIDLSPEFGGGLVIDNPNSPYPASPDIPTAAPGELTGDVESKVRQVLDQWINPAIAAHGGRAELVGVDGEVAMLRLGGGCQGCGMASVTLSQGIETAICQSVPEITRIADVTDHAGGTNPYHPAAAT
jgi:Fe/S biogenesis protein NfuA